MKAARHAHHLSHGHYALSHLLFELTNMEVGYSKIHNKHLCAILD